MPKVFLSPSTQEWNPYIDGGNEEQYMNLIADRMEPYLRSSGITYVRNDPDRMLPEPLQIPTPAISTYTLPFTATPHRNPWQACCGALMCTIPPYDKYSETRGHHCQQLYEHLPLPDKCSAKPTTTLGEVTQTKAPAVLCEIGYHDNREDADWIRNNLTAIAVSLTQSLCDYFGIPLIEAGPVFPRDRCH